MSAQMPIDLNRIKNALADPAAPWYGSNLVPWVADLVDEFERLERRLQEAEEALEALDV
jgi:hypothetical protein